MPFILCILLLVGAVYSLTKCSSENIESLTSSDTMNTTLGSAVEPLIAEVQPTLSEWQERLATIGSNFNFSPVTPFLDAHNLKLADNLPKCDVLIEQVLAVTGLHQQISALAAQRQVEAVLSKGVQVGCFVQKTSLNLVTQGAP
jgi:hypothetical protein